MNSSRHDGEPVLREPVLRALPAVLDPKAWDGLNVAALARFDAITTRTIAAASLEKHSST